MIVFWFNMKNLRSSSNIFFLRCLAVPYNCFQNVRIKMSGRVLTIFFSESNSYISIDARSRGLRYLRNSRVSVPYADGRYIGRIIGRSGTYVCSAFCLFKLFCKEASFVKCTRAMGLELSETSKNCITFVYSHLKPVFVVIVLPI
jgi:hypothetical protein